MKGMASPAACADLALSRVFLFDRISIPTRTSPCPILSLLLDARDLSSPPQCLGGASAPDGPWGFCSGHSAAPQVIGSSIWGNRAFPGVWCEEREGRVSLGWQMALPGQL